MDEAFGLMDRDFRILSLNAEARRALAIETSQRMMATLRGHSGPVYSVAFSREDHYLVSGFS
jgi:hypothetical protein